jgi:multidrug efflux pump subunit AcrB
VVEQTALPLLGATAVAILAFGAIGLSDDSTGEFCRSLFQVVLISLSLSWVTAVTVTPLLGVMFLKPAGAGANADTDPYDTRFYRAYRGFLNAAIRMRWLTVMVVLGIFAASLWGFRYVDQSFFPDSTRPQFLVDFWLPQGTHIQDTVDTAGEVEEYLTGLEGVTHVSTLTGAGGLRFLLTYQPEKKNSAYVQFLVDVEDYRLIDGLIVQTERDMPVKFPDALVYAKRFLLGPGSAKIQARVSGPDLDVLRGIADQIENIMHEDGGAKAIRTDWRQRVKLVQPVLAEEEANRAGIGRPDVAAAIKSSFEGSRVGLYRETDELLPILLRAPQNERGDVASIENIQIWSLAARQAIPLRQVVSSFETVFEDDIIQRLNRKRTITVFAEPDGEQATTVFRRIRPKVEAIEMGPDFELEWWGEYRDSAKAQAGIAASLPMFLLTMVLIVIGLFNALRQPLAIWLIVPLALIGVTLGLLLTKQPFGFMALLGFMSLSGMLVKNAIVLIDEIEAQKKGGVDSYNAIVESGVSRLRPVAMAALTTALGMIPLLLDAFFIAMAVTIIFGLMVATVLTMVVLPVLYAVFFRIRRPAVAA